ncbi:MAG: hypothetical protein ABI759_15860 [Candidatus Solibacter sp.]
MSTETAPAGTSVQFKLRADSPAQIAGGAFTLDLDPTVFGEISDLTVFGATGDALGYAKINGRHAEVHFTSPSGSIGQLPGLPVATFSAPVNAGATVPVTIDTALGPWYDTNGRPYLVTVTGGEFRAGGALSLRNVTPGGGYLPAGTVVRVSGGGFDSSTRVALDGVSIAAQHVTDAQHVEFTLGGATEMTGKHIIVSGGGGERQEFFTAIPSAPSASVSPFTGVFPIVPLSVSQQVTANSTIPSNSAVQNALALMNQHLEPVTVTFLGTPYFGGDYSQVTVVIPPSSMYFLTLNTLSEGQVPRFNTSRYWIRASAPVRMLAWASKAQSFGDSINVGVPGEVPTEPPAVRLPISYPDSVTWTWQAGKAAPAPATIFVSKDLAFTATSSVPWIQTSQSEGNLILTPKLTGLTPGTYSASITLTPVLPPKVTGFKLESFTIRVTLTVTALPLLTTPYCCAFISGGPDMSTSTSPIAIATNGDPVAFTVTTSGEPWLSVKPDRGTTPATLVPAVDLARLQPGTYKAEILVHGPNNTLSVPLTLTVIGPQPPATGQIQVTPSALSFVVETGSAGTPISQSLIALVPQAAVAFAVKVLSGGDWLTTHTVDNRVLSVNVNAVSLAPGTYAAQVVVSAPGYSPFSVPVSLTVLAAPAVSTLRVSAASIALSGVAGSEQDATLTIDSTGGPVLVQAATSPGSPWLHYGVQSGYVAADGKFTTPAKIMIYANSGQAGSFRAAITLQATNNSVTVPVTLDAAPAPTKPPQITSVVNAASGAAGALAPGEIFSIFGLGVGGAVLVNGVPAPLLYTSSGQVNAVVPYEAGASGIAHVKVDVAGVGSGEWGVPLAPAAPAIFTIGASGEGPGAILNQDSTVNSAANPAARGSVVQIFGTGQGITSPPSLTGAISSGAGNPAVLPVKVTIGGVEASLQYQGAAPGLIAGALQVNAVVPARATPGPGLPISISVGGLTSQAGVTIAVR